MLARQPGLAQDPPDLQRFVGPIHLPDHPADPPKLELLDRLNHAPHARHRFGQLGGTLGQPASIPESTFDLRQTDANWRGLATQLLRHLANLPANPLVNLAPVDPRSNPRLFRLREPRRFFDRLRSPSGGIDNMCRVSSPRLPRRDNSQGAGELDHRLRVQLQPLCGRPQGLAGRDHFPERRLQHRTVGLETRRADRPCAVKVAARVAISARAGKYTDQMAMVAMQPYRRDRRLVRKRPPTSPSLSF